MSALTPSLASDRSALVRGAREVQAQLIQPTLHRQRWQLETARTGSPSRVVHLSSGRGIVHHARGELPLRAPDVVWLPAGSARELQIEAGSAGVSVGVSDALLAMALGVHEDEAPLRQVSARLCLATPPEGAWRDELVRSLLAIEAEARSGSGGLRPYLAAHLTIVLVGLWRLTSHEGSEPMHPRPGGQRLLRFRHLVESQFRTRWSVRRYARELGLTPDALHDLCVRSVGRPPLSLVHERIVGEACSLLAGTDLSVERLASDLGFVSPSHFSRFFKRWTGLAPRKWRETARAQAAAGEPRQLTSYGDWP